MSTKEAKEPLLSIQSFHQCSSLISIKLNSTNFLIWRSQIIPLVKSLGLYHHLTDDTKPSLETEDDKGNKTPNLLYELWTTNDGLLVSWLLGTMNEDIISSIFGSEIAYDLWTSLEQQPLPMTVEKEGHLKRMLMTIKKGSRSLEEYLKDFKYDYSHKSEELPQALAALAVNDDIDSSFYVDSGATSHMTNDAGSRSENHSKGT
ncbi:hypothetical protein SESBI_42651 [Sesbania bispinosa]|nr:hypothetical protein SESBI_42651 [Sesbania bispinosa]